MKPLSSNLFAHEDTCTVYVVRNGEEAVLVDFGSGDVLDHLAGIGVRRVTDVLVTHHHRDQVQGLSRLSGTGARIRVPHTEQDLFHSVDAHWAGREIENMYNVREDRFSLRENVPVFDTLRDYATLSLSGISCFIQPTPGHTPGSVSIVAEIDGKRAAFTGDLISGPGTVWSMAATQWSYNGAEGVAASIPSLLDLKALKPDLLLPSHGVPMTDPEGAADLLIGRFRELLSLRGQNPRLFELHERPYLEISPHVLMHRASMANTWVLLSESRKALFLDFGYDFMTGAAAGSDRASRRPWLHTIPALKRLFGVEKIDAVIPTHYHDDHVAGINLLRETEGTRALIPENFADILARPDRWDLPCLWYDPVPADERLPLETPIRWEEYELTLYPLPGHTRFAVGIAFEADGKTFFAAGDQYQGDEGTHANYVYRNRYHPGDYRAGAALYARLSPDIVLPGHWKALETTPGYFRALEAGAERLESLHEQLLPPGNTPGMEGFIARIEPYRAGAEPGDTIEFTAFILNPFPVPAEAVCVPALPPGWSGAEIGHGGRIRLEPFSGGEIQFVVRTPASTRLRRARIALDVTLVTPGFTRRFGEQAEALVSTTTGTSRRER